MAKKAILDVLESTIGKYVKSLDSESLNVAVWKGNIQLHSLELNVDAVNSELDRQAAEAPNLALPFRVMDGEFSSLEVVVPWSRITSKPVILRARGLKVLVEPCDRLSQNHLYDKSIAEKTAKKTEDARIQSLKRADAARLRANALRNLADIDVAAGDDANVDSTNKPTSFGSRLVRRIIENLQVEVNDVHVSLKGAGCSAGVVLSSLSLVTTDKDGNRSFVDRTTASKNVDKSFLYKALRIQGLGVYLDDETSNFAIPMSVPEGRQSDGSDSVQHSYVLSPLSFEAKLRQSDQLECIDFPKYLLSSELSQLSILLSRNQLELGNKIAAAIRPSQNFAIPLFPQYRPLNRVSEETAKEWWRYAVRCIGRLNGRRSWVEFHTAFQKRKKYIPLYKRHAHHETCPWLKPLSIEEVETVITTEQDRAISVEGIMTWRNIADAQVEREKKKHELTKKVSDLGAKKSYLPSFFGASKGEDESPDEEDPPISLTVEEMKELEAISLEQTSESEVSTNSKLYDIKFTLGAFKIDLITHGMRPLAALDMGAVTTTFDAAANGSFRLYLCISGLMVHDKTTLKSLFPTVIRSLRYSSQEEGASTTGAFNVRLEKSKTGDQQLILRMAAFQMVASSVMLKDVKAFFSLSNTASVSASQHFRQNPLLEKSLSGSVDLFYDAGAHSMEAGAVDIVDETAAAARAASAAVSDQLSTALADAWKSKMKTKTTWIIDFDVYAPIIILPESCVDPTTDVLVFDLGHFSLKYGKIEPPQSILEWFSSQPKRSTMKPDPLMDYGELVVSNLMFVTGKTGQLNWDDSMTELKLLKEEQTEAVIEPLSLNLKMGVETAPNDERPRICTFGVLPTVSLRISPAQVKSTVSVLSTWRDVLEDMGAKKSVETVVDAGGISILDEVERDGGRDASSTSVTSSILKRSSAGFQGTSKATTISETPTGIEGGLDDLTVLHFSIALHRLSICAVTDDGDGLEAHLVSVSSSASLTGDGGASCRLKMGWFWILDRLSSDFPREQRLLAHSNLPKPAASFAENDEYNVFAELEKLGAFDDSFSGSTELADITLKMSGRSCSNSIELSDPLAAQFRKENETVAVNSIDATFSSLYVQWNPKAIQAVTSVRSKFSLPQKRLSLPEVSPRLSVIESPLTSPRRESLMKSFESDEFSLSQTKAQLFVLKAEMRHLEISLNSAIDDLPLFEMTMSDTKVSFHSSENGEHSNTKASLELGDVRIEAPTNGKTRQSYKTLLGLAPHQSTSLLSVQYSMGRQAIQSLSLQDEGVDTCDACAKINLSPMRLVYIHSQVLTLVEYVTEGILGALFAKAASSAKDAAIEIASSVIGGKIFAIRAVGADLIIPQAAYSSEHLTLHAGDLNVRYHSPPGPGAVSTASLALSEVSLQDDAGRSMVETPIAMAIDVELPPIGEGTAEQQTMRLVIRISQASFLMSKAQYEQMMNTLELNIGQSDSFLRGVGDRTRLVDENEEHPIEIGASSASTKVDVAPCAHESGLTQGISHAGVVVVDNQRRIYIDFLVDVMSLELCGDDVDARIVRLAAVKTSISFKMIPDEETKLVDMKLLNLVCEDRRLKAVDREFRSLVSQVDNREGDVENDVFRLAYVKKGSKSSELDLRIGSPRFVFIPDAIADVLGFVSLESSGSLTEEGKLTGSEDSSYDEKEIEVHFNEHGEAVETSFVPSREDVSTSSISISTGSCSVVLVDVGYSSNAVRRASMVLSTAGSTGQVMEAIVLQGAWNAKMSRVSEIDGGRLLSTDIEMHGEGMEIYSAHGRFLESPLQIVEPAEVTMVVAMKSRARNSTDVDIKLVTLSPIYMVFSMQNAALVKAISSGFSQSLGSEAKDEQVVHISEQEASRIERLALQLESHSGIEVSSDGKVLHSQPSEAALSSVTSPGSQESTASLSLDVKMTMPETTITFINDLQGMDEALFRTTARSFVAGAQVRSGVVPQAGSTHQVTFDCHVNTSVLADYFDTSTNMWQQLLVKPWEITMNSARGVSRRFNSQRMSTTVDIESFPCHVSFSEQFLVGIGAANRMWSVYSLASADGTAEKISAEAREKVLSSTRSLITTLPYAIENHSGIDAILSLKGERGVERSCPSGTVQYFRFEPPRRQGCGGLRRYGQDVSQLKGLVLMLGDRRIEIENIDEEIKQPRHAHSLGYGRFVTIQVVKEGKTTVLHISSMVDIRNNCSTPIHLAVLKDGETHDIGLCECEHGGRHSTRRRPSSFGVSDARDSEASRSFGIPVDLVGNSGGGSLTEDTSSPSSLLIVPHLVGEDGKTELCGRIDLSFLHESLRRVGDGALQRFEVTCRGQPRDRSLCEGASGIVGYDSDPFVVRVCAKLRMVDRSHPFVDLVVEPRAFLENKMPVSICCRTPMPHTFSTSRKQMRNEQGNPDTTVDEIHGEINHKLSPREILEIHTPGPSIAFTFKFAELPIGGGTTGWNQGGWVDLPLVPEFRLLEPLRCTFPFLRGITEDPLGRPSVGGIVFFIAEENSEPLSEAQLEKQGSIVSDGTDHPPTRNQLSASGQELAYNASQTTSKFVVTVCNYAVDHTGDVLFEQLNAGGDYKLRRSLTSVEASARRRSSADRISTPFSAFSSPSQRRRISLLPDSTVSLRLLHLTMDGEDGVRRSQPFRVEDVSICEGGIESTMIRWEDESPSGFFAYRRLVNSYQSEVHVVPEFIVFNGSKRDRVLIRQFQGVQMILEPGKMAPMRKIEEVGLVLSMDFIDLGVSTVPFPCDTLGLKMCVVKAADGSPVGSLAVQTVIGAEDSRLAVKLGKIKYGQTAPTFDARSSSGGFFSNDFFRLRVRWSELEVTLNESKSVAEEKPIMETTLDQIYNEIKPQPTSSPFGVAGLTSPDGSTETWMEARRRRNESQDELLEDTHQAVAVIMLHRFTVDFQRVFKDEVTASKRTLVQSALISPERSQLSVIVHNVVVKDSSPNAAYPVVFDCRSSSSFFDLCIRCRGPLQADLVSVDMVDLKLAYANGKSERIVVETSEEFVWKLLDVINRILVSTAELAGVDLRLQWDDQQQGYSVSVVDATPETYMAENIDDAGRYTPPDSDKLYDIHSVTVSPFKMLLSFKRQPQASRYKHLTDVRFAKLMNYFTKRLKFKIDKAELNFGRYEATNVKGPPDRLFEILKAYYVGKIKLKFVTLMTAVSIQDWKYLASREGDENWKEGDYVRLTGNIAGSGAGYVLKKVGAGLGDGLSAVTGALGQGVEDATDRVGARAIGAGVNSVVTGVGDGVGNTIKGVGAGAGKVVKGAGKGVGHVFGGVTGGAQQIAKGVGKGVATGDGRAVLSGLGEGVASVGAGVGQGVESVVSGAADGALTIGSGVVSGFKSIGQGIGGVFGGCSCNCSGHFPFCCWCGNSDSTSSSVGNDEDRIEDTQAHTYQLLEE